MSTLREAFSRTIGFIPDLVAGVIVLAIGWLIAAGLRRAVVELLPRAGFDRFLARHGVVNRPSDQRAGSRALATATYWVVLLVALMQACNIWRLGFVADGIARVIAFIPNLIAATFIFGVAFLIGNWVRDRMRESRSEQQTTTILPGAVRAAILTIGAFIALRQLFVATEILVIAFTLVFGAISVATALAFGLGGRSAAQKMTEDWYDGQRARRRKMVGGPGETTGLEGPDALH